MSFTPRIPGFYEEFMNFVFAACPECNLVSADPVNVLRIRGGSISIRWEQSKRRFLDMNNARKLPGYTPCVRLMLQDDTIRRHLESLYGKNLRNDEYVSFIESGYLRPFIELLVETVGSPSFDLPTFDKLYRKLEDYLHEKEKKIMELFLLLHFDSEEDEIQIEKSLKIRRIPEEEREKMWRDVKDLGIELIDSHMIPSASFGIEYVWGPKGGRPKASVEDLTTALTLFKPESWVDHYGSIHYEITWMKRYSGNSGKSHPASSKPYKLTKEDIERFKDFWDREYFPVIITQNHFLNIAIQRFRDFRTRRRWTNGLIDLVITLEAMYMKRRERKGMRERLPRRCATFLGLGKKEEEKERISELVKAAYDLRSAIVHGGKPKWEKGLKKINSGLRTHEFIHSTIAELSRKSVRNFLKLNSGLNLNDKKQYKNFIDKIDEARSDESILLSYLESIDTSFKLVDF